MANRIKTFINKLFKSKETETTTKTEKIRIDVNISPRPGKYIAPYGGFSQIAIPQRNVPVSEVFEKQSEPLIYFGTDLTGRY